MAFFQQDFLLRELCAQSSSSSQGHGAKLQSGKTSPPDELRLQLARSTIESVEQSLASSPSVFRSGHPIDLPGRCTKSYDPKGGPATKQTSGVQTGVQKGDRDTRVKRQHNIYFRLGLQRVILPTDNIVTVLINSTRTVWRTFSSNLNVKTRMNIHVP
jgi:hypothetical protein